MGEQENLILKLGETGVIQEDNLSSSIFRNVYRRAGNLAASIVEAQMKQEYSKALAYQQPDNIITFVGRRGTGKSSSMLSFMEELKKVKRLSKLREIGNAETDSNEAYKDQNGEIQFIGLEWIDASTLEKGEDIFEMLLAKILGEILEYDTANRALKPQEEYRVRELHRRIGSIYKKVLNLKRRNGKLYLEGESPISALRELARSTDLRKEFEDLIQEYVSLKREGEGRYLQYGFLVVAIDDVDMNIDNGFDILEQILRYLKVKGLLVLLSVDYEQMLKCCEKHFEKLYEKQEKKRQIAESYITKVLPFNMRVYLPSLKKKDYDRERTIKVNASLIRKAGAESKDAELTIKEALFWLIRDRLGVRYDSEGKKRHFIEPTNLRNLNNYFLFLKGMNEISRGGDFGDIDDIDFRKMEVNYRRYMDDLLFRFAEEYLSGEARDYFISLSEEDIRRRGEIILANFLMEVGKISPQQLRYTAFSDKYGGGQIHGLLEETERYGYSYGQLMRCLYFMGREIVYEKHLVHALLAMYTVSMTKIFYRYRKELKEKNGENNYKMLKTLLGNSAAGTWSLFIMPLLQASEERKDELFTGAAMAELPERFVEESRIRDRFNEVKEAVEKEKEALKEAIKGLMREMVPEVGLFLLLDNFQNASFADSVNVLHIRAIEDPLVSGEKEKTRFFEKGTTAQFNVLNFIQNIFIFDEIAKSLILSILDMAGYEDEATEKKRFAGEILRELQQNEDIKVGFYYEMKKWQENYGGAVVPFYSADIYYNMLKRLSRDKKRNPVPPIAKEHLFVQFQKLLKEIQMHLKKSDDFYEINVEGGEKDSFTQAFAQCPVIKLYLGESENNDDTQRIKVFGDLYNNFVFDMIMADKKTKELKTVIDRTEFLGN